MRVEKRKQSIHNRIFVPIISIVVVQLILLLCVNLFGGLMKEVDEQSWQNLKGRANNQQKYVQNKMVKEWSNISGYAETFEKQIENYLKKNSVLPEELEPDSPYMNGLLAETADTVISMLRSAGSTGAFLILSGEKEPKTGANLPGFYLRDLEPDSASADNGDIQIHVGLPEVTQSMDIPLAGNWTVRFHMDKEHFEDMGFFYVPYRDAKANPGRDTRDYGYWSGFYHMGAFGDAVLTYSIPLVVQNHVIGVIGIDVTENEMENVFQVNGDYPKSDTCYILGIMEGEDSKKIHVVKKYGRLCSYNFGNQEEIICYPKPDSEFYRLENRKKESNPVEACVEGIKVYSADSSHYNSKWVLVAGENQATLFSASINIRRFLVYMTVGMLILMIIMVHIASKRISLPIRRVVKDLGSMNIGGEYEVRKTDIEEIDELLDAFEKVKTMTEEYARKVSDMIEITNMPIGIFEYDTDENVVFYSRSLFHVLEWEEPERSEPVMRGDIFMEMFEEARKNIVDAEKNIYLIDGPEGRKKWVRIHMEAENHQIIGAVIDVTGEVLERQKIAYERDYDVLTGLRNRRAFRETLSELESKKDELGLGALIMVDTDNLKYVNDTYGHETGDDYLKKIADILRSFEEYGGVCGRRSGDEFYVFLYGFSSRDKIREVIQKVWNRLNTEALDLPGQAKFFLHCSAGIAWYPDDSSDMDMLIRYADFAMYQVKHSFKGNYVEFNREEYNREALFLYGHETLNKLLSENYLEFAMQPILDVHTKQVYGYEMLMRPDLKELTSPLDAVRMAQSQSKLHQLEYTVWRRAMETWEEKQKSGEISGDCHIFINSIGDILLSEKQKEELEKEFGSLCVPVVLEITEESFASEESINVKAKEIHDKGGKIAIDDFGSGYNNMTMLFMMNPDIIKIDMSIIRNIHEDAERRIIFTQAVKLAGIHGALVVAEGVETKEEMECVIRLGADLIQGYFVGKPAFHVRPVNPEALELLDKDFS